MGQKTEKKKSPLKRIILWVSGFIVIFLVFSYFFLISEYFIKTILLPRGGSYIHRTISAETVDFSPFSALEVTAFEIVDPVKPEEPKLLSIDRINLHYSLWSFMSGNPVISAVDLVNPEFNIIVYADGSTSLDDMVAPDSDGAGSEEEREQPEPANDKGAMPGFPLLTIGRFTLENGSIHVSQRALDGSETGFYRINDITVSLKDFSPGSKAEFKSHLSLLVKDELQKIRIEQSEVAFDAELTSSQDGTEGMVVANLLLQNVRGTAQGNSLDGLKVVAEINGQKDKQKIIVKPLSLQVTQGEKRGGDFTIEGHYSPASREGEFLFNLDKVNKTALNVVGALIGGVDFRTTTLETRWKLVIKNAGDMFALDGTFNLDKFSIKAAGIAAEATAPLDLASACSLTYEGKQKSLTIPKFDLSGIQRGRTFLTGSLREELKLYLGTRTESKTVDSPIKYNLKIEDFGIAQYQALLPLPENMTLNSGLLSSDLNLIFKDNGQQIYCEGIVGLAKLSGQSGDLKIPQSDFTIKLKTTLSEMDKLDIPSLDFTMQPLSGKKSIFHVQGKTELTAGKSDLAIEMKQFDLGLAGLFVGKETLKLRKGMLAGKVSLNLDNHFTNLGTSGQIVLSDFSGLVTGLNIRDLTVTSDLNLQFRDFKELEMKKVKLSLLPEQQGGTCSMDGNLDLSSGKGELTVQLNNIRASTANRLLKTPLGTMEFEKLDLNYNGAVKFDDAFKNIGLSGTLASKEFHLIDRNSRRNVLEPMALEFTYDMQKQGADLLLRPTRISFQPIGKPGESIQIEGTLKEQQQNKLVMKVPMKGEFKISSEKLTLHNLLPPPLEDSTESTGNEEKSGDKSRQKQGTDKTAASDAEITPQQELAPLTLAWLDMTAELNIDQFLFRQLDMKNYKATMLIRDNIISFPAFSATINEGTIDFTMTIDGKNPGWSYTSAGRVTNIPLTPLLASFTPDYADKLTGIATLDFTIQGQGTLLENLERYLTGKITGTIIDGEIRNLKTLDAIANTLNIKELNEMKFFKTTLDIDLQDGKAKIRELLLTGKLKKLGIEGWIGYNQLLDLNFIVALADPLNRKMKDLKYVDQILNDADGYTEFPVPVAVKGSVTEPKASFDLRNALKDKGKNFLKGMFEKELDKFLDDSSGKELTPTPEMTQTPPPETVGTPPDESTEEQTSQP